MNISADIRGLLQYVPEFSGRIFVVDLDWSEGDDALKAEILMDLAALQRVGVKLVISLAEALTSSFYDYSTEVEFRVSSAVRSPYDHDVIDVLERGQAVMVARKDELLSDALIDLSVKLDAKKIILVSEGASLIEGGEVVNFLHISKLLELDTNSPILTKSREACIKGIARVHLLDIQCPGVILSELFSTEGVGTMIYTDSYRMVRSLREEDISEMLSMIGRSVRNTHLVPRTYEEVKENMSDYYVMEVDDNVVGCGALYEYDGCAEIACLYVKQSHEKTGYGADIVKFLEQVAIDKGISYVFALSNRAATFFRDVLEYEEESIDCLPTGRKKRLLDSGRESRVFSKKLI